MSSEPAGAKGELKFPLLKRAHTPKCPKHQRRPRSQPRALTAGLYPLLLGGAGLKVGERGCGENPAGCVAGLCARPRPSPPVPQVQMVKMSELKEHLPRECLPETLGGCLKLDPLSWNCRFLPQQNGHPDPLDELILVPLVAPKDNGSVHVPGPRSVTLPELLEHVGRKQKRGIYEEYEEIRRRSPAGTFACSL